MATIKVFRKSLMTISFFPVPDSEVALGPALRATAYHRNPLHTTLFFRLSRC